MNLKNDLYKQETHESAPDLLSLEDDPKKISPLPAILEKG
jgi:hypothetical protein